MLRSIEAVSCGSSLKKVTLKVSRLSAVSSANTSIDHFVGERLMSKFGHIVVESAALGAFSDPTADPKTLSLKKRAEAEIRTKLDEFAKELSQVKKHRERH